MITNKPRDLWSFVSLRFHNLLVNLSPNDFEFDGLTLEQFQESLELSKKGKIYKESNVYFDCKNLKIVLVKDFDKERFPINQYIPVSNCFGMRYNWTFEEAIEIFQKELLDIEKNLSVQNFSDFSQINQYDFIDLRTPFGHIFQDKSSDEKTYIFSMFHPDFWSANNKYREVYGEGRYHTLQRRFPNFLDTIQHINVNQIYHSSDEYDRMFEWLYKRELERIVKDYFEHKLSSQLESEHFKNNVEQLVEVYKVEYWNKKPIDKKFLSLVKIPLFHTIPVLLFIENEIKTISPLPNLNVNKHLQLVVTYNEYRNFEDDFVELLIQYLSEIVSVEEVVKYIANIISDLIKNQLILVGKISTLVELKELSEKGLLSLHSLSYNQLKQFYFELLDKEYTEDELAFTAKTFKDFILFRQIAKELQLRKQNKKED